MWNGQQTTDGIARVPGNSSGRDSDVGIPPDAQHAVSALAAFQQGAASNFNSVTPPFNIPAVYPTTTDMEYLRRLPAAGIPPYGGHPPHPAYYQHHRLPYATRNDDHQHHGYQPILQPQENLSNRFGGDQILQRSYSEAGPIPPTFNHAALQVQDQQMDDSEEDEDDSDEENLHADFAQQQVYPTAPPPPPPPAPRGKPEAVAMRLAASRVDVVHPFVAESDERVKSQQDLGVEPNEEEIIAKQLSLPQIEAPEIIQPTNKKSKKPKQQSSNPNSISKKKSKMNSVDSLEAKSSVSKKKQLSNVPSSENIDRSDFLLNEAAPLLTSSEYKNLEALLTQFCRVPLLAEFSRPVSLLHPELGAFYNKIVKHPVDIGRVCRGIRRRQYRNTRDVRLDMWRVFANCVKFHSHPKNKEATPSFVSIAIHLRDYFNHLWQEYMIPSDYSSVGDGVRNGLEGELVSRVRRYAFSRRDEERRKRLENSGVLVLSKQFTKKKASLLQAFIDTGGCVDDLDSQRLFGLDNDSREVRALVSNLQRYKERLEHVSVSLDVEYTLDNFHSDLQECYTSNGILDENQLLKNRIRSRIDRFFWKQAVPLHEANSRGVTQSSIWGNIAATIWARESSKKPYWPALCLGILPPTEQREGWHDAVTERNEARLPEKLRGQLMTAKLRCEAAQKKQSLSYFLVEFLGTHEFIWVRETDIIENFDPKEDPNKDAKSSSKKSRENRKNASAVIGSKAYQLALDECVWAFDEYESVLQDAFEYVSDNEDDGEEVVNYSYPLLSQSDDEADEEYGRGYSYDEDSMSVSEVEESNWLVSRNGVLDTSAAGRKDAKLRASAMKKESSNKKESSSKKKGARSKEMNEYGASPNEQIEKENKKTKEFREKKLRPDKKEAKYSDQKISAKGKKLEQTRQREEKKALRDLEKRRKKRIREREKVSRMEERKAKRRRSGMNYDSDEDERGLNRDKRARAAAIVKGYCSRLANEDDFRSLALSGVMTMPAAMVDSVGLLGMALAFRAAAGEIPMPDDGDDHVAKSQPWLALTTSAEMTPDERIAIYSKQAELLEKEIHHVRADTQFRTELAEQHISKHLTEVKDVEADDVAARENHYKMRKKPTPRSSNGNDDSVDRKSNRSKTSEKKKAKDSDDIAKDSDDIAKDSDDMSIESEESLM